MFTFEEQRSPYALCAPGYRALFVLLAGGQQLLVQLGNSGSLGNRHPMIPPKISRFSFHAAFLLRFIRCTKPSLKLPVGTEGHETGRLFAPRPTQHLLHSRSQIVVPKPLKYAREVGKCPFMRFQKSLLGRM